MGKVKPKYLGIAESLRNDIKNGTYAINEMLPDGKTLAEQYTVSLMTMKRALDTLVAEGYIIRRRGAGTFVRDWKHNQLPHLYSLNGTFHDYGERLSSKIIQFTIEQAGEKIAEKLGVTSDSFVYHIVRLRILDNRPIIMEYTYMPIDVIPGLKKEHLSRSIYAYINNELGRKVHSAYVKVSGERPTIFEQKEMELLESDFLMSIEQVSCLDDCRVFEYSISHHLPDTFHFETVMFN